MFQVPARSHVQLLCNPLQRHRAAWIALSQADSALCQKDHTQPSQSCQERSRMIASAMPSDGIEAEQVLPKPRAARLLIISACVLLLLALPCYYAVRKLLAMQRQVTIVASFRDDFRPETPVPGWRYLWNKSGPILFSNSAAPHKLRAYCIYR